MKKEIALDMDGTWVDFYGVESWLDYLLKEDTTPYEIAKPLVNLSALARQLNRLQANGYTIGIISWCSKNGSNEFNEQVKIAKLKWIKKHIPSVNWDYIKIVSYGTPKSTCGQGILFDDEERNRNEWNGTAFDVDNIIEVLKSL